MVKLPRYLIGAALLMLVPLAPSLAIAEPGAEPPDDDGTPPTMLGFAAVATPVITDKGSVVAHDLAVGQQSATIPSIAIAQGASIIVAASAHGILGAYVSVTWNGLALAQDVTLSSWDGAHGGRGAIYSRHGNTAATGDVVVTMTTSTTAPLTVAALQVTRLLSAAATDKTASANGTSTSPSSGATTTTAQASEVLIGAIAYPDEANTARGGTWSNSFIGVHEITDTPGFVPGPYNSHLATGYRIVSATGVYTAAKTGVTASHVDGRGWLAMIATYKVAP